MQLTVTPQASAWFKRELALPAGAGVRFFGKVYGKTTAHDGFSVGLQRDDEVINAALQTQADGVTYWVAAGDAWFFADLSLTVGYDERRNEPVYDFVPEPAS